MRATELSITFEDDEHHEFVERYEGDDAELLRSIMHIATDCEIRPTFVGPVLRKVTEAEGHVEDTRGDDPYIAGRWYGKSKLDVLLVDVLPAETRKDCTAYRFRVVVEAVPVTRGETP